ncbi:MAG: polysaccharide pyruvyl transferase CsaB [Bacillota bacterium]|nr:polysaccharide pyruvyl transferase CsaB [Bacillota bacterium]
MSKILLAGYYGFNNIGDEAILEMFLRIIEKRTSKSNIRILTADPDKTKKKFDIEGIDRYSFTKVNKGIYNSDIVIVGGGSLLQDITSKRSIYYYLYIIFIAKLLNKKIALLSQGIGPINGKINKIITAKVLNNVDYISVRDKNSMTELENLGINRDNILYSADPVINYDLDISRVKSKKINIGFSLRKWNNSNIVEKVKKLIKKFDEEKYKFTFIPFHYDEDVNILENLEKEFKNCKVIKERLTIQEIYKNIANLDIMIGVRLHSLIFATAAGIPVIGISYDPKVDSFLESIGEDKIFQIENFDVNDLFDEINYKLEHKELNQDKIKELKNSINSNIKIIDNLLEGCNDE